jgi:hypothetical protein
MAAAVTVFTKTGTASDPSVLLCKRLSLAENGSLNTDSASCRMSEGIAERMPAETANDLQKIIKVLRGENALALGVSEHDEARVVTASALAQRGAGDLNGRPVIARTRDHINYRGGPSWSLVDFDHKGMPTGLDRRIDAAGGMWAALLEVAPGLAKAARVARASRSDTSEDVPGAGGEHHYVLVADGADVDRALVALHDRCWLHGLGWYPIGSVGQLLERGLIDPSVRFGERLCFEGPPEIVTPLSQDSAVRQPIAFEGEAIDTRVIIPSLTAYEQTRVEEIKQRARAELEPRAAIIKNEADRKLAERISARDGVPFEVALRTAVARHRGLLPPGLELDFDHIGICTVRDVLADPDRFIGETLCDPLEGASYGRDKAKVFRAKTDLRRLIVHSFAHGGAVYDLRHDASTINAAIEAAEAKHVVTALCNRVPYGEIDADELVELIAKTAKKAGVGVRSIQSRLKTERVKREQAAHQAEHVRAALEDMRLTRPLPYNDGELTPIVDMVDEALASDTSEEPPMRDADGQIVEVRVREPWGLHLLTATGSNADPTTDNQETLPAPPEPMLVRLAPVDAALLVERYLRFVVLPTEKSPGYEARLQRPYIDALMALGLGRSRMPEVRAIVTTPMVAKNGKVIAGIGLDHATKLLYRIEPQMLACLPTEDELTPENVAAQLRWLLGEWLVDVKADMHGKLLAIMNALSKIERVLARELPGWIFTAGHRGGGKTTLITMINMAVFGRLTAAAAWSNTEEERRKALFAYFRQGVATICWDNIARGTQITSPAIEKAMTSAEMSDRILGVSDKQTVPTSTVMDFTGNMISGKGDMASRTFRIVINVDRPDPENRDFTHPDVIGWTAQNRARILKALYVLLIYGCRNRPADQTAKTRFKDWWSLCGWPVELAASLIGEKIDCSELLAAGEKADEETHVAAEMLSLLRTQYGDREFTAKEISALIAAGTPTAFGMPVPEAAKDKADKLLDLFGEMSGRRLSRPTPGPIGMLLKNRLVDRPTFIDDTNNAAVLRRGEKDHSGAYRIELLPGPDRKYISSEPAPAELSSPSSLSSRLSADGGGEPAGTTGTTGTISGQSEVPEHVISRDGTASGPGGKYTSSDPQSAVEGTRSPRSPRSLEQFSSSGTAGGAGAVNGQSDNSEPVIPPNGQDADSDLGEVERLVVKTWHENPKWPDTKIARTCGLTAKRVKAILASYARSL